LRKRLLGENHPDVASSLNNLAALYDSQGRYESAEPLYLQALELRQRLLGENHPDVATSLNNLAELYRSQGRDEEAEPLYLKALLIAEVSLGREHPNTKTFRNNLRIMRQQQKPTSLTWWQWIIAILLTPFYFSWMLIRWLLRRFIR
jgi:tetratricopeptide (TPR) repeat protein